MFYNFSEEARKIMNIAKEEMMKLKHPYVGTEHLLLSILSFKNSVSMKLKKYDIDYDIVKKEIINIIGEGNQVSDCFLYTPVVKNVIENANEISKEYNCDISPDIIFLGLLEEGEGIAIRLLISMGLDLDKLYQECIIKHTKKGKKKKLYIDEIGLDLTKKAQNNEFDPVIGRNSEVKRLIEILTRRTKNNPMLIGEAGVGKTALVEELSRKIVLGEVPNKLLGKRIINIDISSLVAGTKYRGEFEDKVNKIIKEIEEQDDVILFIDEIHTLVGAGGAEGAVDAANILKPALARNKLHCIGATTIDEYKKYIENDKALDRRFQTILLNEPNEEEVKEIIYKLCPIYEKYHKVSISKNLLDLLIKLSNKYIKNRMNPDKTIDILDEVCAHANLKENKKTIKYRELTKELNNIMEIKKQYILDNKFTKAITYKEKENILMSEINKLEVELSSNIINKVTKKDLKDVFKMKIDIPIYELSNCQNYNYLTKSLSNDIIGQDKAIEQLVNTYITNLNENKCYGIMFSGASGVGKTALAQLFAKKVSNNCIRLDMSEYAESHSISKLIGSPAGYVGYGDNQHILDKVRTYPFTVLILDEIERAHPKVIDLFLQILDNNKLKDASGKDIYFNNVIIVMTTNIVSSGSLGFKKDNHSRKELNNFFGVPFINRLANIITFEKMSEKTIEKIIEKICKQNFNGLKLKNEEKQEIIKKSNYLEYGARQVYNNVKKYNHQSLIKTN